MKSKKAASFILSLIVAVSSINMCLAETQADGNGKTETMDNVVSEAAADYGISLTSLDEYTYEVKGGNIYLNYDSFKKSYVVVNADYDIIEANIPQTVNGTPVTEIASAAFQSCRKLTKVTIPNSVAKIDEWAFMDCYTLTNIIIPDSVTYIGKEAFLGCTSLMDITIPYGVTNIGDRAFGTCTSLMSINVNENNSSYSSQDGILYNKNKTRLIQVPIKKAIQYFTIPNSVISIENRAFEHCRSLISIYIPGSVTNIMASSFLGCSSLMSINIDESNPAYLSVNGVLYNKDKTELILVPAAKDIKEFTVPDSVVSIGGDAFFNCSLLTNIIIPNSVTSIGNYAFDGCSSLTDIAIPDSVTSLGSYSFFDCTSLKNITISNSITSIGNCTFYNCTSLTDITIPNSVTSIGYYSFADCGSLTGITIPDSVTNINAQAFYNCDKDKLILYVKQESYADAWAKENGFKESYDALPTTTTTETSTQPTTSQVTESGTEATTKAASSSSGGGGGGGGGGSSSSKKTTTTTTTEATTVKSEPTTEATTAKAEPNATGNKTIPNTIPEVKVTIGKDVISIDGKDYKMDASAYIQSESNSTLVPLRFVAVVLSGDDIENADNSKAIAWDAAAKQATVTKDNMKAVFTAGSNIVEVNGVKTAMENGVKAEIKEGRMYVPFRAIGNFLGVQVDWDANTKTAIYKAK